MRQGTINTLKGTINTLKGAINTLNSECEAFIDPILLDQHRRQAAQYLFILPKALFLRVVGHRASSQSPSIRRAFRHKRPQSLCHNRECHASEVFAAPRESLT